MKIIEKLQKTNRIKYSWDRFHRWVEKFDADLYRSWQAAKGKGKIKKEI